MLAISGQHVAVLATVIYFALRAFAVSIASRAIVTLVPIWLYILVAGAPPSAIRAGVVATLVLVAGLLGRQVAQGDSQSYNGLKVRFSATVGKEPEVEVGLV